MKQTPNYNLPQFEAEDKFYKEILNEAYNKIDTAISDLQETFNNSASDGALTTQEVIDARKGKLSLEDKIDDIDNYLENIDNNKISSVSNLNNNIRIDTVFKFETGDSDYDRFQGMCVTSKYIIIGIISASDSNNTYIYFFDKNTYSLIKTKKDYSFKHCNSMTYNEKENTVSIVGLDNTVYIVNAETFDIIKTKTLSHSCVSIAYDKINNCYFIDRGNNTVYCYNADFEEIYNFKVLDTVSRGLTLQGLECHNELLFFPYSSGVEPIGGSNAIFVYDLKGNLIKTYMLGNIGEIEDLAYIDGKLIGNFKQGKFCYIYSLSIFALTKFSKEDYIKGFTAQGNEYLLKSGDNLNDFLIEGSYRANGIGIGGAIINSPTSFNFKLKVECIQNPLWILQTVIDRDNNVYTRIKDDSNNWSDWNLTSTTRKYTISNGNDLNSFTKEGIYTSDSGAITTSLKNIPTNIGYAFRMEVKKLLQSDNVEQTITSRHLNNENNVGIWKRTYNTIDGWGYWYKIEAKIEKNINQGDDLNNYTKIGKYISPNGTITTSLLNAPSGIGYSVILEVIPQYEYTSVMQVLRSRHLNGQTSTGIWVRTYNSTDRWGSWFKIQMT